ncbi:phosphate ABC transporter membrane protein 1, PhoT family [Actinokineospora alba]|uniref:Phosphate transport system permease protein n=1 Tax=Actinokineospora alba TaxID=504798 RepID=A0A1H0M414_9PSEU|nr:phosphate ABC transporter permease subunit PstC [Actinokineospora alba]TDP67579.1 phosphate ABC transporter membrane protein 1 (PhoT family) [Actinokineospora alba]SDI45118.1 phosphate transport system permease protein [Actinokineospora alba]SDO75198.1 phosphate ABC transporter membrane protein 1, PhoT family [Actinokineospora alba]
MSQVITEPDLVGHEVRPPDGPRRRVRPSGGVDRVFRVLLRAAGVAVLAIMATVGLFLLTRGSSAFAAAGFDFLTVAAWEPDSLNFGIAAVLVGTLLIAAVALTVAFPLALGVALYISEYAPRRIRRVLTSMVDLMAAVPSVVYGLFGSVFLQWQGVDIPRWLSIQFGWVPFLSVPGADPDNPLAGDSVYVTSTFWAGLIVGFMVMPFICSVMRESFTQAPQGEREGALALGSTRWGMIRSVVLPFGRSGMIGGTMLGLGRALGETIAVAMIIAPVFTIQTHILGKGGHSVSALIAQQWGSATAFGLSALMAAGLALFALTLVVNFAASAVIARSRSGQGSDA